MVTTVNSMIAAARCYCIANESNDCPSVARIWTTTGPKTLGEPELCQRGITARIRGRFGESPDGDEITVYRGALLYMRVRFPNESRYMETLYHVGCGAMSDVGVVEHPLLCPTGYHTEEGAPLIIPKISANEFFELLQECHRRKATASFWFIIPPMSPTYAIFSVTIEKNAPVGCPRRVSVNTSGPFPEYRDPVWKDDAWRVVEIAPCGMDRDLELHVGPFRLDKDLSDWSEDPSKAAFPRAEMEVLMHVIDKVGIYRDADEKFDAFKVAVLDGTDLLL